jgi:hypothetical protein
MILKFRTMIGGEPSWSIISDIDTVDYRRIPKTDRTHPNFSPDYYVMDLGKNGKINESNQDYIYVTACTKKHIGVTICSNMVIYLLNDEGKTIERIN